MATPSGPIRTQVDIELENAPRGAELAAGVAQRMRDRAPIGAPTVQRATEPQAGKLVLTWGDVQQRHPEWLGEYWAECRALYAGGQRLLGDKPVLERLFPQHAHEAPSVYEHRKKRAHYYPYAGTIIDHLLAGLGTDPLTVSFAEEDAKTGEQNLASEAEWWERWVQDVTDTAERPSDYGLEDDDDGEDDDEGGTSLHHFLVDVLREALQTRTAWVLADLPEIDPDEDARDGAPRIPGDDKGDPYLCIVPAEQVIDWQTDERGRLTWAIIMTQEQIRASPKDRRGKVRHTFIMWDVDEWAKYQIDVDPTQLPQAETVVPYVGGGPHPFGRVPLERLVLTEGMYAMGKLHSIAREHFNKRCAMSWAEFKSLFAVLYEFNGPEDKGGMPVPDAQTDSDRATNQIRGQGYTQIRGADDRAEYIGPDVAPFKEARESCNDAMREMHRVMFSMALSANMDGAALKRSGDSKEQDSMTTAVLLDAFGTLIRRFMRRMFVLASLGRGEAVPKARVTGLEQFDVAGTTEAIAEAVELFNGVPILSPLFKELALARLYSKYLGNLSPDQAVEMREQIRNNLEAESSLMAQGLLPTPGGAPADAIDKLPDPEPPDPEDAPPRREPGKSGIKSRPRPKR